jgi:hypothetical protein
MADALADILAARALIVDVFTQQNDGFCSATDARILADLCTLAAGRAAGRVAQTCVGVYFGYAERFPIIAEAKSAFDDLQRNLCHSLNGTRDAQLRLALFLCGAKASL